MKKWFAISLVAWTVHAIAEKLPTPADLPPTSSARHWIDQDPAVVEARSAQRAADHTATMLTVSPNEWAARAAAQRRAYDGTGAASREWNVQIERQIRVNGKAGLDRQLGETEREIADARVGEAIHESARLLSDIWLDALFTAQTDRLYREQKAFAQTNLDAVDKRKRAGDASALDLSVATADISDVERQAILASTNLAKAMARLRVRFPGAQLPNQPLGDPIATMKTESEWVRLVLEAADPLRVAERQLKKAELTASRASADRVPDPTLGVFTASEAYRQERIVGVSISIPFGGTYRNAKLAQALQEAEVARAAVDRQRQELVSETATTYAEAEGSTLRWRTAERAAQATSESARLTQRAYSLGEADLQSLLLARRQHLDAARAALEARADALRANYRLLIDAHLIWDLSHD